MEPLISILLVEDNPGDVRLLQHMMRGVTPPGVEFTCAERIADALERCNQTHFDVILLDLSLPDSTGLESFLTLQARIPSVPIVVLTGFADEELAIRAVRQGAQDYLVKGQVDQNLLVRAIRYAIERKQVEKKLISYQTRLRSLTAKISLTEEQERRRIATDVHDHIGQTLALAKIKLGLLQKQAGPDHLREPIEEIRAILEPAIQYSRSLTFDLSSPILYELGFEAAMEALLDQFQRQHLLATEFENDPAPKLLDDDTQIILFRAVRELLVNIIKHARAGKVRVNIRKGENEICIEVLDDGIGFDLARIQPLTDKTGGFGLFNIQERLDFIGGNIEIHSQPGVGTRIVLHAPLKENAAKNRGKNEN